MNKHRLLIFILLLIVLSIGMYFTVFLSMSNRPDNVRLITLLQNNKYDKLNGILSKRQAAYKSDITEEINFSLSIDAFANADPKHEALMTEWIEKQPDSYLPYLVRGVYYGDLGYTWRSTDSSRNTSNQQFKKMVNYHQKAYLDLEKSIQLNPTTTAYSTLIDLSSSGRGEKSREEILKDGLALLPASYIIRKSYLFKIMPRWGGSYEQIDAFIDDTKLYIDKNPALNPLLGFKDYVVGYNLQSSGKYEEAVEYYTKALSHGEKDWYIKQRGTAYMQIKDYDAAIHDMSKALELLPHFQSALTWRGITYFKMGKYDESMADYNLASKLEPYDYLVRKNRGILHSQLNQYQDAINDYKAALYYEKHHADTWHTMGWILNYKLKDYKKAVTAHKTATEQRPRIPSYWYEYAVALNNKRDCDIIPAFEKYLALCETSTDKKCSDEYQKWANDMTVFLLDSGKC